MNKNLIKHITLVFVLVATILMSGCSTIRRNPGKIFLTKTKLTTDNNDLDYYDLWGLIKQKENRKILYAFRFHTTVYNIGASMKDRSAIKEKKIRKKIAKKKEKQKKIIAKGKEKVAEAKEKNKTSIEYKYQKKKEKFDVNEAEELAKSKRGFRYGLMNTVGEEPVFYDSLLTKQSIEQMQLYCRNNGYFNAEVSDTVKYRRKNRKAKITYSIEAGTPYTINKMEYVTSDPSIRAYLLAGKKNALIGPGKVYNEDLLDNERTRINDDLKNLGYYAFSKSYIRYEIDSALGNHTLDVKLIVNRPYNIQRNVRDSIQFYDHRRYQIRNIFVLSDYSITGNEVVVADTTVYVKTPRNKTDFDTITFVHFGKLRVKPKTISRKIFFRPNSWFNLSDANKTQSELSNLNVFKYINIRFQPDSITDPMQKTVPMDAYIELSMSPVQSINVEIEGTNSSGNLGTAGNIVYKNKNLFNGAEQFTYKIKGGLELQKSVFSNEDDVIGGLPFNSAEISSDATLSRPVTNNLFTQSSRPMIRYSMGFNYQFRPDYQRYISQLKTTLEWRESENQTMQVYLPINLVRIMPDSLFAIRISQFSRTIRYSYEDHFIPGFGFTLLKNTQTSRKDKPYHYRKLNVEQAGVTLWIGNGLNFATQGEVFRVLGINYSQYFKVDFDYRHYIPLRAENMLVGRVFVGAGLPYGNSVLLPFEKSYSASGSNDVRAWKFRSLGPGVYSDSTSFDRTGDISLVLNLEYRFPIFSWFKGALFVDAGNVWTTYSNEEFPGGVFKFGRFYKQLGVGPGFGLRMDFDFFIFRIDAALPVIDPAEAEGERWLGFTRFNKTNFSFGIGYPF